MDLDNMIEGLDENLEPIVVDEKPEEVVEEKTEKEEKAEEIQEESAEKEEPESSKEEPEEGYAIDDNDSEGEPEAPVSVSTQENKNSQTITPEQEFLIQNIQPILVRGTVDGKPVEISAYAPENLPEGFTYNSDRDRSIYDKTFGAMESKAIQLQQDFRNQETVKAGKAFREAEETADRQDIGELQREGIIPKFKLQPNDKNFDSDPAAALIQKVLDFKDAENQKYLEAANSGRPYRHIGFEEAYYKYQRVTPAAKETTALAKEDQERKEFAKRTSKTSGTEPGKALGKTERFTNSRDMFNYLDGLEF